MTYIAGCAGGGEHDCGTLTTLAAAQKACAALPYDSIQRAASYAGPDACSGVTFQYGHYQLRRSPALTAAPKPSTSWLITNSEACQRQYTSPPTPAPTPVKPDQSAFNHSKAAYEGLARTDPDAIWVR
jgi:hypothetical protein